MTHDLPTSRLDAAERHLRQDLAAAYRLAALRGWDDIVWTHISAALPGQPGAYLINRFGLRFSEITASNLVKVNVQGQVIDGSNASVNPSGFAIHGAIHAARADAVCVMHLHTLWGQTLAALPQGLLPCSQAAMRWHGRLGHHAYEGMAFDAEEQARLVSALGTRDGLVLAQHGVLSVGRTVAEAFVLMHWLERATLIQLGAMAATGGMPAQASDAVARLAHAQWVGDGRTPEGTDEWPALLRSLEPADADYRD